MSEDDDGEALRRMQELFSRIQRDEYAQHERALLDRVDDLKRAIADVTGRGNLDAGDASVLADAREMLGRFESITMNLIAEHVGDLSSHGRLLAQIGVLLGSAFTVGQYSVVGLDQKLASARNPASARNIKAAKVKSRSEIVWQAASDYWANNKSMQGNSYQAIYGGGSIFDAANQALGAAGHNTYSASGMHAVLKREWAKRTSKLK